MEGKSPPKRKADLAPDEEEDENRAPKRQKPDSPPHQDDNKGKIKIEIEEVEEEAQSVISFVDDRGRNIRDDDDVDKFLSDDSLSDIDADNILPERIRPRDALELLSPIAQSMNDDDDVNDCDYVVDEQNEGKEEMEKEAEEQKQDKEEKEKK